ncbi:MAG: hypothetical protein KDE20_29095, partial [Caldilineaceae bacterium]|nr:hypothetical protein [Caldilineaceae bacterium]
AMVTAGVVALTLLLLAPLISLMPQATLGSLVLVAAAGLIKIGEFQDMAQIRRTELIWALLAMLAVIVLGSYPLLHIEVSEPVEGPIGLPALMRFQRSSDEMTGSTRWVKEVPMWGPIAQSYIDEERAHPDSPVAPIRSMVDYDDDLMDYTPGTGFVVDSVAHNSVMEEVWYFSGQADRRIIFNQFYYPGWTAYLLDGEH